MEKPLESAKQALAPPGLYMALVCARAGMNAGFAGTFSKLDAYLLKLQG